MLIPQVTPIQPINVILQQPPGPPLWLTIIRKQCAREKLGGAPRSTLKDMNIAHF
jgi:hypothetical protein